MQGKSEDQMEPPADSGPDREGFSSRREFIRSLAAISAGLTVAAPLGRAANLAEEEHSQKRSSGPERDPGMGGNQTPSEWQYRTRGDYG